MGEFYAWLRCLFDRFAGRSTHDRFIRLRLRRVHSEIEKIIHWMAEILLAAEITFRGLDRCVTEQELNLLNLATAVVAQLGTSSTQVVRRNVTQTCFATAIPDHTPHDILRVPLPQIFPLRATARKTLPHVTLAARVDWSALLLPSSESARADVATFADQINDGPVALTNLDFVQLYSDEFRSSETAAEQHGQHRVVTLGSHTVTTRMVQNFRTLLRTQPITGTEPSCLTPFTRLMPAANSGLSKPASAAS